jgi:(1->4)-alpha-D-glucan 1-alpha-D-glucosylmutase
VTPLDPRLGVPRAPTSTYRLQLNGAFGFRDALAIVDYLGALGVGAAYSSPILKARTGSMHGYDVVDHRALNPEIGTREDFDAWTSALATRGLGHLLDFVPNHMGVGGGENAWWNDVLEHGQSSLYADHFDVDWSPPTNALTGKVLLPVLGSQIGLELDARKITLARDGGAFFVRYAASRYPASPRSYCTILEPAVARLTIPPTDPSSSELASIVSSIRHLPPASTTVEDDRAARARESDVMKRRLRALFETSSEVVAAVDATLLEINESPDKLDAFLLDQNYRLASWRVASDEINYRRFFDLNDLAAIRTEDARVFADVHELLLQLVAEGRVTGLRLDHTDGLYDPAAYFSALREALQATLKAEDDGERAPFYVVAEKILALDEEAPRAWAIAGTTGYDFLGAANGVWVDPSAEAVLEEIHRTFAGATSYERTVYTSKRAILRTAVSSEVHALAHELKAIADGRRRARDFSFTTLLQAIEETLLAFPVYRTYVRPDGSRQPSDEAHVRSALRTARRRRGPLMDPSVFDFLGEMLLLGERAEEVVHFAMRFQQLSSPVMAKGIEDTAMYRHAVLVSNNDVGCDPGRFATLPQALHEHNAAMLAKWPLTMTATTTHDTKRSEDVRARIAALSEATDEWRAATGRLREIAARHVVPLGGEPAPSPLDEYVFFQIAVGAYPYEGLATPGERETFTDRIVSYMLKAAHEAKLSTSWLAPNAEYDETLERFVRGALGDPAFRQALESFVDLVMPHGATNSLALLALRLGSPGVPDVYQGTEMWDLSLVDPDNRRPVDFGRRRAALAELDARGPATPALARELVRSYRDGRIKLHVLRVGLRERKSAPDLFLRGAYRPLASSPHVIAFERTLGEERLVVVVPRITRRLVSEPAFALGDAWKDDTLDTSRGAIWTSSFSGEVIEGRKLFLRDVFRHFPVAWLRAGHQEARP